MNLSTDSILFLFLFIFPGAFSKLLKNKFAPNSKVVKESKSSLMETSEIVVTSVTVLLINLFILGRFCNIKIENLNQFTELTGQGQFLIKYIEFTFVSTIGFTFLFYYFNKYPLLFLINAINKKKQRLTETQNTTLWENIFENKKIVCNSKAPIIVSIEKDGEVLSRGELSQFSPPHINCSELILENCTYIEEFFERDLMKDFDDKFFAFTVFEYTILDQGITIKFYDNTKYVEYRNAQNSINP